MGFEIPRCSRCHEELTERGAILYGPPEVALGRSELCSKWHLCITCYDGIIGEFPPRPADADGSPTDRPPPMSLPSLPSE